MQVEKQLTSDEKNLIQGMHTDPSKLAQQPSRTLAKRSALTSVAAAPGVTMLQNDVAECVSDEAASEVES